ncbi:MAG: hypothetical protein ABGW90_07660, partial [Martelella sp.]
MQVRSQKKVATATGLAAGTSVAVGSGDKGACGLGWLCMKSTVNAAPMTERISNRVTYTPQRTHETGLFWLNLTFF